MDTLKNGKYFGERALFASRDLKIYDSVFFDGESPLKESAGIELYGCSFEWKYPLWYCKDVFACGCKFTEGARSGIWYTDGITMKNILSYAPKTFRRAKNIIYKR